MIHSLYEYVQLINDQVVPESSAVIGLPNEMIVPLNADHRGMCRFPSSYDQNYTMVEFNIREIAFGEIARQGM